MKGRYCLLEPQLTLFDPRRSERIRSSRPGPSLLDVCRCPRCRAPLVVRQGRCGPYFHCACRRA